VAVLKLTLQYDGTNYAGWQRQKGQVSIQGLLEDALAPIAGAPVVVHGAGRTDAGVHALGQVASVSLETLILARLDEPAVQRALNAVLPPDVRVWAVERAADDFHARYSARAKSYEYRIVNAPFVSPFDHRYAWHLPRPVDVEAMRRAASALVGRHDFAAFQATGSAVKTTMREVYSLEVRHEPPLIMLRVRADGFLRHMVRTIVGTLAEVGSGRLPERMPAVLASRDRGQAGPTAPAHGLFLLSVDY
jgi:tRNA pseudouridine38-40 synthase